MSIPFTFIKAKLVYCIQMTNEADFVWEFIVQNPIVALEKDEPFESLFTIQYLVDMKELKPIYLCLICRKVCKRKINILKWMFLLLSHFIQSNPDVLSGVLIWQ